VSTCKKVDPKIIGKIKTDIIKRNGIVEIVETTVDIANVGGLKAVKDWLGKRVKAFGKEAREFGLKTPKGLLAIGISGSGKSLIAKTVAGILGVPMLRLDGGKIYGMWVGESEKNMRAALNTADAMSPCVLMIDEFEKAFSGMHSEGGGGTTQRVIGTFLQWMQDKTSQVFIVATANDVAQLPPEILRRGRFDQIFFVDLPDKEEREQIWSIHINKAGRKPKDYDLVALAENTDGYTGAEIETIVNDGLVNAWHESKELTTESLAAAIHETVPLSSTMRERVTAMRKWADGRAINASGKTKVKS
jgi:SpoVK/Ycf46/Vps4 family AAA+-type ATPase